MSCLLLACPQVEFECTDDDIENSPVCSVDVTSALPWLQSSSIAMTSHMIWHLDARKHLFSLVHKVSSVCARNFIPEANERGRRGEIL